MNFLTGNLTNSVWAGARICCINTLTFCAAFRVILRFIAVVGFCTTWTDNWTTICCIMAVVLAFKTMERVGNIRTDRAAKVGSFNYILQSRAIERLICFLGSTCLFRKILIRRACIIFLALKSCRNCSFVKGVRDTFSKKFYVLS